MEYFSDIFGLITKSDPTTENGGLFFAHYLVLKIMLGLSLEKFDYNIYLEKMNGSFIDYGLYLRSSQHKERTVSHDEITGFMVGSYILGTRERFAIWEKLKKGFGNYPATGSSKFYNPGNYYSWALLGESKLSPLFATWYTVNLLISSNKSAKDTSAKLIYTTELFIMKEKSWYSNILWKYFSWRMKLMYGEKWVKSLYDIYFASEDLDHPLRKLSREVK